MRLAKGLRAGDCIALIGELGSGKTTFVKGLARGFGFKKNRYVCSPSFVILKIYHGRLPVYHFDLYRLGRVRDFYDTGLVEFMEADGVCVIEWAQKFKGALPKGGITIEISMRAKSQRSFKFFTSSPRLERFLKKITS